MALSEIGENGKAYCVTVMSHQRDFEPNLTSQ